jgi:hypothetical protein
MAVLELRGTEIFPTRVVPLVPAGGTPDLGTRRVFSEDLREPGSDVVVGQHSGTCVHVRQPNMWLCHAGWTLEKVGPGAGKSGNLMAGGLVDFAAAPPFSVAIFGGTGDYGTARGEIEADPVPDTDPREWAFKIDVVT